MQSEMTRKEWRYARQRGVNVYPVKGCADAELDYASLPNWMKKAHFFDLDREWETFVNYLQSDREPKPVAFMAPDVSEGFIQRPREFEQLIAQLVDAKQENPIAITTALQGAGGYGKTTIGRWSKQWLVSYSRLGTKRKGFPSAEDFLKSRQLRNTACLILDVRMPSMGGLELQRRLAAGNYRIPIIFITSYDSDDVHIQAFQVGAVGLLCKPFSQESLFQAVRSALANDIEHAN